MIALVVRLTLSVGGLLALWTCVAALLAFALRGVDLVAP